MEGICKYNYYKLVAIKKVIETITKFKKVITDDTITNLSMIKGIGDKTIARLNEIIKTGHLSEIK